jgi:hypothetical protein
MRMVAFWPTRSPTGEVVKVGFGSNWAYLLGPGRRTGLGWASVITQSLNPAFPGWNNLHSVDTRLAAPTGREAFSLTCPRGEGQHRPR